MSIFKKILIVRSFILVSLISISVATQTPSLDLRSGPRKGINPKLTKYVDRFERIGDILYGRKMILPEMDIDFGKTRLISMRAVGWCVRNPITRRPKILIDTNFWKQADEAEREALIFHELGHCVLDRDHIKKKSALGIPLSLMFPSVIPSFTYRKFRKHYLIELFINTSIETQRKLGVMDD